MVKNKKFQKMPKISLARNTYFSGVFRGFEKILTKILRSFQQFSASDLVFRGFEVIYIGFEAFVQKNAK